MTKQTNTSDAMWASTSTWDTSSIDISNTNISLGNYTDILSIGINDFGNYNYTNGSGHLTGGSGHLTRKMQIDGDLEIDGVSMKEFMKTVNERLNMLTPNPKLEGEWEELKALGDQYRALEQQIKDKMKTWEILESEPKRFK